MARSRSFRSWTPVFCADFPINAKELLKYPWPAVRFLCRDRRGSTQDRQFLAAQVFDGVGQRCRRIFARPRFLFVKDDPVHVTAANANDRRSAGLTFERDQAKGFLHARMNEEIGGAMVTCQIFGLSAVLEPRNVPDARAQFL